LHKIVFCVPKNRDGPIFSFRQILNTQTSKLEEDKEHDDKADQVEKKATAIAEEVEQMENMVQDDETRKGKAQSEMDKVREDMENKLKNDKSKSISAVLKNYKVGT